MDARVIDSTRCFECSAPAEVEHHVVPRSRGGTMTIPLCGRCHGRAHHTNRNMATSEITRAALQAKRRRGERAGSVPYGFALASADTATAFSRAGLPITLIPVAEEQAVIQRILRERAAGASLRMIAKGLTDDGVPTKNALTRWSYSAIYRIVGRPSSDALSAPP